jgi:hypothetical protein
MEKRGRIPIIVTECLSASAASRCSRERPSSSLFFVRSLDKRVDTTCAFGRVTRQLSGRHVVPILVATTYSHLVAARYSRHTSSGCLPREHCSTGRLPVVVKRFFDRKNAICWFAFVATRCRYERAYALRDVYTVETCVRATRCQVETCVRAT